MDVSSEATGPGRALALALGEIRIFRNPKEFRIPLLFEKVLHAQITDAVLVAWWGKLLVISHRDAGSSIYIIYLNIFL